MVVLGMNRHVHGQHGEVIWNSYSGLAQIHWILVLGMNGHVRWQQKMVIWNYYNGLTPKGVLGKMLKASHLGYA